MNPPCVVFEDDHLLVVNKPAGLNTHAPAPYAGEGLYEWLRHREPRWASLAIIHRLDKETSGLIVFSKTQLANRSLTQQFTERVVRKKYLLLTDRDVPPKTFQVKSTLVRVGDKYVSRPARTGSDLAETRFAPAGPAASGKGRTLEAEPLTGRTHQIRVHAADRGFPILGDMRYGGTSYARVCLHAAELSFRHPASGDAVSFAAPAAFATDPVVALRRALIDPRVTSAFRVVHGASDGWPGWYVDVLGAHLLSQSAQPLTPAHEARLVELAESLAAAGVYHKPLSAAARAAGPREASPQLLLGAPAPERFAILENGLSFDLSFSEGYSVGVFLDQRDNRRRLLTGHIAAGFEWPHTARSTEDSPAIQRGAATPRSPGTFTPPSSAPVQVLNTFAYTCGFSVCAARGGSRLTSLDLSRKYLDWGQANFRLNQLNPEEHSFIFGEVFDWLRRLYKKGRAFDSMLLDPPTFSRSKSSGSFRAEKDYGKLAEAALLLLKPGGVLFASCNTATWPAEEFLTMVRASARSSRRTILQEQYFPQPPDFPVSRAEPAYLKTAWFRLG